MGRCQTCEKEIAADARFCEHCGTPTGDLSDMATRTSLAGQSADPPSASRPASSASSAAGVLASAQGGEGAYAPGTLLAGRYRIVGVIGEGGMGRVYRADDLTLGQAVALKFLPDSVRQSPARLERFHAEVRVARQVSHPNVCRVHDVGEADGHVFLTMELVEGGDLGTMLRRIGRMPQDKGLEIARQLCAGLAAAHEKGVVHRDLKPANVMLDDHGRAKIADFGLAGLSSDIKGDEVRSGTPAYMAPEALSGREVTARSDIYALGLVLYELFTGRRAFGGKTLAELSEQHESVTPAPPDELVDQLDPAVAAIVMRCLEKSPAARPGSALAVSAALPGSDPLADALAAGETPSPELVADAGGQGRQALGKSAALLALLLAGLALFAGASSRLLLTREVPFDRPPAVLADRARETLASLGYTETPADSTGGFFSDETLYEHLGEEYGRSAQRALSREGVLARVRYWYREATRELTTRSAETGSVGRTVPAMTQAGMVRAEFDTTGHLVALIAVPDWALEVPEGGFPVPDGTLLFEAAGLDPALFEPTSPKTRAPVNTDVQLAWAGNVGEDVSVPVRIEAGYANGRPVFFSVKGAWSGPGGGRGGGNWGELIVVLAIVLSLFAVRRNLGSADRAGAILIAAVAFVLEFLAWLGTAHHVAEFREVAYVLRGVGHWLFIAAVVWLFYIALEPSARRRWPERLIGWSRVLAGRYRDPLVGRDVLAGALGGLAIALISRFGNLLDSAASGEGLEALPFSLMSVSSAGRLFSVPAESLRNGMINGLFFLIVLLFFTIVLRRTWLAVTVTTGLLFAVIVLNNDWGAWVFGLIACALLLVIMTVLLRYGLLATVVTFAVTNVLTTFPTSFSLGGWLTPYAFLPWLLVGGVGIWAFRTSVGVKAAR